MFAYLVCLLVFVVWCVSVLCMGPVLGSSDGVLVFVWVRVPHAVAVCCCTVVLRLCCVGVCLGCVGIGVCVRVV